MGLKCNAVILLHKIESHLAGLVIKSACQTLLSSIHLQSILVLQGARTVSSEEVQQYLHISVTYALYCSDGTNSGFVCQPLLMSSHIHRLCCHVSWHS